MKEKLKKYFEKVKSLLYPQLDERSKECIDKDNIDNLYRMGRYTSVCQLILLCVFFIPGLTQLDDRISLYISLFGCVIMYFGCHDIIKYYSKLNKKWCEIFVIIIYFYMNTWAVGMSLWSYALDRQIMLLYVVQIFSACFLLFHPLVTIIITSIVYLELFVGLCIIDSGILPGFETRAPHYHIVNFLAVAFITVVGSVMRYRNNLEKINRIFENEELNKKLMEMSCFDFLTGLKNRYSLKEDVCKLEKEEVYIMISDIDDFKSINDSYGHDAGDVVLKEFARILENTFGSENCYRYGGDEFVVMLKKDETRDFEYKVKNWQHTFRNTIFLNEGVYFTCSGGYITGRINHIDDLRKLIKLADQNLYRAKLCGKDSVIH
ncbi:diguanylate cyclase (GGDEF) domain-containing protein [Acetitomaculum ruminis DSM 5522]|uniref:Diguanylate cyclase (GGDEF) domain-containing protein n=1 Tax=Acetitomaculum ruminis DSM 5522 TaxID=1120918 RepID=A0A1I0WKQ2_9FIRM|nr:GGDEF domain-containing protein [Acetitomaculum ruminis]SFA88977.1 diguanylate cyclase (GGDEF) domain-containing protein [Acetitomaculum ruminis DSM 5522]